MAIVRIEELRYGVEEMGECVRFFSDVGLEPIEVTGERASFRTPVNQYVHLLPADHPDLPKTPVSGPMLREVVWGVDSAEALDRLAAALRTDRAVRFEHGEIHSHDESGFGIGFRVALPHAVEVTPQPANVLGHVERRNEEFHPHGRARPIRIIHVAFDITAQSRESATRFYVDRLGFRSIDTVLPMGSFMQCEGDIEHHNFLLCHRPDRLAINHIALEVRDIDEVVEGGNHMTQAGWKESRRLGRHNLGSNVFRMFHSPCGGRIEFASDMDRMDKTFTPRLWEKTPPHNLWMLKFPGDDTRDG
jgi:catechol-2,3-dioxygenase